MNKLKQLLKRNQSNIERHTVTNIIKNAECTEIELDKWAMSDFVSSKLSPITHNRPFPLDELMLMASAVCLVKPQIIFDWGTHIGKSARVFHETAKYFKIDCEIHSIDLPDDVDHVEHPGQERGAMVRGLADVTLHQGDGVKTAIQIYKDKKPSSVLFYIDGDHSYESVVSELGHIIKNVKAPAILLHDTFYQSDESNYNVGPNKAIEEVLATQKIKPRRIDTTLGLPGMTLLIF